MALWVIPVNPTLPDQTFQIDLDSDIFTFRFVYNLRTDRWAMSLYDALGNPLLLGLAVVTNWKLIDRFKTPGLPLGRLFTVDVTGQNTEPSATTFGSSVLLMYDEATNTGAG